MKLRIVWPAKTLYKYNGADEMDTTIDDYIFPAIMRPIIAEHLVCKTKIDWDSASRESDNKFSIEIDLFYANIEWQKVLEEIKLIKMDLDIELFLGTEKNELILKYSDFEEHKNQRLKKNKKTNE